MGGVNGRPEESAPSSTLRACWRPHRELRGGRPSEPSPSRCDSYEHDNKKADRDHRRGTHPMEDATFALVDDTPYESAGNLIAEVKGVVM